MCIVYMYMYIYTIHYIILYYTILYCIIYIYMCIYIYIYVYMSKLQKARLPAAPRARFGKHGKHRRDLWPR